MKPHTNFRTVPVTERLPEKDGTYIVHSKIYNDVREAEFKLFENEHYPKYNYKIWEDNYDWWAEEIPEQAEHENPFCPYCGNFKRMPGNDLIVPLCVCTDWRKQAEVKSDDLTKIIIRLSQLIQNFKELDGNTELEILEIAVSDLKDLRHEFAQQPKPTDEDIEDDLLDALEHICHNAAVIQLVAKSKGSLLEESYHIALETIDKAKDCRDGKIVKPKE